ncbi:hypothetical protein A2U01_0068598, partial [Trifolium medium]|nr:hypothetical protein [Trifolium medium]
MKFVQELVDSWNRKPVLHRDGVEGAIIDAKPPRTILLTDQQNRGRERTGARA